MRRLVAFVLFVVVVATANALGASAGEVAKLSQSETDAEVFMDVHATRP